MAKKAGRNNARQEISLSKKNKGTRRSPCRDAKVKRFR